MILAWSNSKTSLNVGTTTSLDITATSGTNAATITSGTASLLLSTTTAHARRAIFLKVDVQN